MSGLSVSTSILTNWLKGSLNCCSGTAVDTVKTGIIQNKFWFLHLSFNTWPSDNVSIKRLDGLKWVTLRAEYCRGWWWWGLKNDTGLPSFFHFKCPIYQNGKIWKPMFHFMLKVSSCYNFFPHILLRIKNYTLHTSPFKRKFYYAALQPKELPKKNLSNRSSWFKEQTQTSAKYKSKNWFFIGLFFGLSRGKWVLSMVFAAWD